LRAEGRRDPRRGRFIEAIGLLRAAPKDLAAPLRDGGGVGEWIWKGGEYAKAHGFDLLGRIDPETVRDACPDFADRFFRALEG
jgi:hypothetical protein